MAESIFAGMTGWLDGWLAEHGPLAVLRAIFYALGWIGQHTLGGMVASSNTMDVLTRLQPGLSVEDPTALAVSAAARGLFGGIIGVACVALGFTVLVSFGGVDGKEAATFLPRIGIAAVMLSLLPNFLGGALALANGLADTLTRNAASLVGVANANLNPEEAGGAMAAIAFMAAVLFVGRIVMHAMLALVAMTGPLAVAAFVYGPWSQWFWRWLTTLFVVCGGAVLQSLLMAAGASMFTRAVASTSNADERSLVAGSVAVATMAVAVGAPALLGGSIFAGSVIGHMRRALRATHMRDKLRAPAGTPAATSAVSGAVPPPPAASSPAATTSPSGSSGGSGGTSGGGFPPQGVTDAEFVPRPAPLAPEAVYEQVPSLPGGTAGLPDSRSPRAPRNYLSE